MFGFRRWSNCGNAMTQLAREKTTRGEWRMDWVSYVRAYHILDFSRWKQHDAYQVEFQKLLKALKAKAG